MFWLINCLIGVCTPRAPRRPREGGPTPGLDLLLARLDRHEPHSPDEYLPAVRPAADWIRGRYDCSDFRAAKLLWLVMTGPVPEDALAELRDALLGMRYWLCDDRTDNKPDSICYYSENHQLVFAADEYLAGTLWPEARFTSDGRSGAEHADSARERLLLWFGLRERYGFSEFYSANYLPIDLAGLALLLRFAPDAELREKARRTADMILTLYAETLFEGSFVNASGRAYPRNNMNCALNEPNSELVIRAAFGVPEGLPDTDRFGPRLTAWLFGALLRARDENGRPYYEVPPETLALARDPSPRETVRTFGLPLSRYREEGLTDGSTCALMMQLGSGALTNPEVIGQTLRLVREKRLWQNDFVGWLRFLESPLLRLLGLMPLASRAARYFQNGMALGEATVKTLRTPAWKLSCLQGYAAGSSGAQKTTFAATLPGGVTVFVNHPLCGPGMKKGRFGADRSPGYFGGYGIAPFSCSDENRALTIYRLPLLRPFFAPCRMLPYTHAFFPEELFTHSLVEGRFAFAEKDGSFLALIGKNPFERLPFDAAAASVTEGRLRDESRSFDLKQPGRRSYWICELSDAERETFEAFCERVRRTPVEFDGRRLRYGDLTAEYKESSL